MAQALLDRSQRLKFIEKVPPDLAAFLCDLCISIMGGLVVARALTLVFVPALYATWFRVRRESPAWAPATAPTTAIV